MGRGKREKEEGVRGEHLGFGLSSSSYTDTDPLRVIFMTSSKRNYLSKVSPPKTTTLGTGASVYEFGEDADIQPSAAYKSVTHSAVQTVGHQ